jgi:sugar lactone lactonase YvrE
VVWHPGEEAVYWTDINRFLIHRFEPASESVKSWLFDEPVTAVLLTSSDDTLLVCLGSRVIFWQPISDSRRDQGFRLPGWPAVRLNDAGIDPRGSLWAGSMRNNVNPDGSEGEAGGTDGALYRVDPDGRATCWQTQVGISNTVVWNRESNRFYFGDTLANSIRKYEFDPLTGAIGSPTDHFAGFSRGLPDGSAIDEEGCIWNCRWGGGCVVRVTPGGVVDHVIELPTRNITNATFGGKNLDVLYITTAACREDVGDRLAGGLFAVQTNVRGAAESRFRLPGA